MLKIEGIVMDFSKLKLNVRIGIGFSIMALILIFVVVLTEINVNETSNITHNVISRITRLDNFRKRQI